MLSGLVGIFGVWLTAGLALPMVNVLKAFKPFQLMLVRGLVTAVVAALLLEGRVKFSNSVTIYGALCFAFACLGLFKSIRLLGAAYLSYSMI